MSWTLDAEPIIAQRLFREFARRGHTGGKEQHQVTGQAPRGEQAPVPFGRTKPFTDPRPRPVPLPPAFGASVAAPTRRRLHVFPVHARPSP
ncbi:hypothetical protein GCM10020227_60770 [Streptomyces flavovirens]